MASNDSEPRSLGLTALSDPHPSQPSDSPHPDSAAEASSNHMVNVTAPSDPIAGREEASGSGRRGSDSQSRLERRAAVPKCISEFAATLRSDAGGSDVKLADDNMGRMSRGQACRRCRVRKLKCRFEEGQTDCLACQRRGLTCVVDAPKNLKGRGNRGATRSGSASSRPREAPSLHDLDTMRPPRASSSASSDQFPSGPESGSGSPNTYWSGDDLGRNEPQLQEHSPYSIPYYAPPYAVAPCVDWPWASTNPSSSNHALGYLSSPDMLPIDQSLSLADPPRAIPQPTIVNSSMSPAEIVNALKEHGCADLTQKLNLESCGSFPISNGGSGDVYSGQLHDGIRVAIKVFRLHVVHGQSGKHLKHAAKELHTWSKCQHPNVLRLLGLVEFRGQIGMVSPWMEQGDLRAYIHRNPNVDRYRLCLEICNGLAYLHDIGIIHGDLKGANVLISNAGIPLLTDFGNSILSDQSIQFTKTVASSNLSLRWTAPEVLNGLITFSYPADIFSLGMTLLETITGNVPYHELERDVAVITAITVRNVIPSRPELYIPTQSPGHDALWNLLTCCWWYDPEGRPNAIQVRDQIQLLQPALSFQAARLVQQTYDG